MRPALVIKRVSDSYDDWLICMISTQVHQKINGLDELIDSTDEDYTNSGLKETSLFRVSRLAVVEESLFLGTIGEISTERLKRIRDSIAQWIRKT